MSLSQETAPSEITSPVAWAHDSVTGWRPGRRLTRLTYELVKGFRPHAGQLARDVVAGIRQSVPEYERPLSGAFGQLLMTSTQTVLLRCNDALLDPDAPRDDWKPVFRRIGKLEWDEGRSLEALQNAYRVAGQIVWRRGLQYARTHGAPTEVLRWCTEAISGYFEELAELSTEGYLAAKAESSGGLELKRRELVRLLLSGPGSDPRTLAGAARVARWQLPEAVKVIALDGCPLVKDPPADLGDDVLVDLESPEPCLIVAADALPALPLPGWRAAIGPSVSPSHAHESLRVARRALALTERGLIPAQPVIDCAEHTIPLTVFADELLIDTLIERRLAPLQPLSASQQERMLVTLNAWLATRGRVMEIADRLHVHPQTVRTRVHRLTELFGDQLDDAHSRFELEVATRAKLLLCAPPPLPR
ncbi:PucR family transcriptional regulator [Amycolatopsis sp. H20-H5]|uniref:PucR family transcriptional regulator n=1 Tax=Amycolatopsis sp. H20-H5 TaxID=3046309 RepID=UPI002DBAFFDA|nr:helix-turn-helix domain-containing protein [Amycolatopsis sp. H20-H5]MEC3982531.1 helix-turn-helix domain-containing protein [Amycolatopsis sp. H20-H5]